VTFDPEKAVWRKSSYSSGGESNCVEVAMTDELVAVRDSKDPQSGHFVLTPEAWRGLLAVAKKHGEQ
jgi:hypothetical protein